MVLRRSAAKKRCEQTPPMRGFGAVSEFLRKPPAVVLQITTRPRQTVLVPESFNIHGALAI
jgi:hypothetical protein